MSTRLPYIAGYAARFLVPSTGIAEYIEILHPGCFDKSLADRDRVVSKINHDDELTPLGDTLDGTLSLWVDSLGLRYLIDTPDNNIGRRAVQLVRDGQMTRSSFAFKVRDGGERWDYTKWPKHREVLDVVLADVAPATQRTAYDCTSVWLQDRDRSPTDDLTRLRAEIAEQQKYLDTLTQRIRR